VFAKTPASARTDASAETPEAQPPAPQAVEPEVVMTRSTVIAPRQEARSYETHATQMTEAEIMPPTPTGGRSLEDTVKDMLRPMLRQWLNENMPRIVEKVAREEMLSRTDRDDDKE
jgi:cell pole-organizing protein PopZ